MTRLQGTAMLVLCRVSLIKHPQRAVAWRLPYHCADANDGIVGPRLGHTLGNHWQLKAAGHPCNLKRAAKNVSGVVLQLHDSAAACWAWCV